MDDQGSEQFPSNRTAELGTISSKSSSDGFALPSPVPQHPTIGADESANVEMPNSFEQHPIDMVIEPGNPSEEDDVHLEGDVGVPERDVTPPEEFDPLLISPSATVLEGDHVLLIFGDGRQVFAHCVTSWKGKSPPLKINKRSYPTANLIGLSYGTVLELDQTRGGLVPLPEGEDIVPDISEYLSCSNPDGVFPSSSFIGGSGSVSGSNMSMGSGLASSDEDGEEIMDASMPSGSLSVARGVSGRSGSRYLTRRSTPPPTYADQLSDNRHLVDSNNAQSITQKQLMQMKHSGQYSGSTIVQCLIDNSSTFGRKTDFSKAKYLTRKTKKHQPRCRLVRCTAASISEAMFLKNPRMVLNLREDSLAQMMSYANVYAGAQVLIMENCLGIISGAVAQRMGGYGKILSVYTSQQPAWSDMMKKFNLSFAENHSIKWIHSGEIFGVGEADVSGANGGAEMIDEMQKEKEEIDVELRERQTLKWPCPLQDHTRKHLGKMTSSVEQADFLSKRCSRFARKLTRHTMVEAKRLLLHQSDSLIVACKYDPTETLLQLLPYLAASCPFVVFSEHMEPLVECFRELQKQNLAINLRLTDTWLREYQVLQGRTHPNMTISQSGGYLLSGIKLCPVTGHNEIQEDVMRELRAQVGGRRGKKTAKAGKGKGKKGANGNGTANGGRESKRARFS